MASTLICLKPSSPFFLHTPNPTHQPLLHPTTRKPIRKLHVQAQKMPKGFGSNPNLQNNTNQSTSNQEQEQEIPVKNKEEDEIPQAVIERMAVRIVVSVVGPMGIGLVLLSGFGTLRDQNVNVPIWMPIASSFLTFGASALGIAYGALSSSWDPERKGSVLGLEQLERNWIELWKE